MAAYSFKIFGQFQEHLGTPQDQVNLTSWQCGLHKLHTKVNLAKWVLNECQLSILAKWTWQTETSNWQNN
jgi:hypothetical protein